MQIGVVGLRVLLDPEQARRQCREALSIVPAGGADVMSSLAEGADRIGAAAALERLNVKLVAVVPLPVDDYAADFRDQASRREFESLFAQASEIVMFPPDLARPHAYRRASQYIVDRCDVLLAIWDGVSSGQVGGTGDTIAYARSQNKPIHVIEVGRSREAAR